MKKAYQRMPVVDLGDYILRTIKKQDYHDMFDYGRDPLVTQNLNWGPFVSEGEAKNSILHIFFPRIKEGLPIGYAIIDKKKSKMIGTIDFHSKIKGGNGAEIGYVIHRDYWNQGIMTRALRKVIEIGFDYLKYDVIVIKHLKANVASRKVIEKSGFKLIRTEPYYFEKPKSILSDELLIYELKKEDYHVNQQSQRNL